MKKFKKRCSRVHKKNGFAKVSQNLSKYRLENNFVWTIKKIKIITKLSKTFILIVRMLKFLQLINVLYNYYNYII